jgi:hypothetical protein
MTKTQDTQKIYPQKKIKNEKINKKQPSQCNARNVQKSRRIRLLHAWQPD